MKLIFLVLGLVLLTGCETPNSNSFSESEAVFIEASSDIEIASNESDSVVSEIEVISDAEETLIEDNNEPATPQDDDSFSSQPEAEPRTDTPVSQEKEPIISPNTDAPATPPPSEMEPITTEPTAEPTVTAEPTIEEEPSIPAFEVEQYVSYGKNYGVSIGLQLDSSATACWDDPITANAGSIYLERDICDRLDWYLSSGFTAFWVWAVNVGDGNYQIYIGYA